MHIGKTGKIQKSKCLYCGNNPVPHFIFWYSESLNILLTPIRQFLLYNPVSVFLKQKLLDVKIWRALLFFGLFLRLVRLQKDAAKCKVRRAQVLWEEAKKRNIEMSEVLFLGKSIDVYTAKKENKQIIFSGLPRPERQSNNWLDLMDDKWRLKKLLIQNDLPVAIGESCTTLNRALKVFDRIQNKKGAQSSIFNLQSEIFVIVKPQSGSRGRHTTTFIKTQEDLIKAFKIAKKLCHWVIVEEQLTGPVYRATVINFELCGLLRGDPPEILGDGVSSIQKLIEQKNLAPHEGVKNILITPFMELFLSRQHLNLNSLLPKDQRVTLSEKIGVSYGGSSSEDFELCHPENKELFEKAAKVLNDPIVGFDFIIPDVSKSWKEQTSGFIEANSLPFINLHYDPLLGTPRNIAKHIWDMLEM